MLPVLWGSNGILSVSVSTYHAWPLLFHVQLDLSPPVISTGPTSSSMPSLRMWPARLRLSPRVAASMSDAEQSRPENGKLLGVFVGLVSCSVVCCL